MGKNIFSTILDIVEKLGQYVSIKNAEDIIKTQTENLFNKCFQQFEQEGVTECSSSAFHNKSNQVRSGNDCIALV